MIVRKYEDTDHDQSSELVAKGLSRKLPKKLGGHGVVIEEDSRIVAFVWALVTPTSDIAFVDFLVVAEEKRNQKIYGPLILTRLLVELKKIGAVEVMGHLADGAPYTETEARIFHEVGMITNHGYVTYGEIDNILEGMKKRYGG